MRSGKYAEEDGVENGGEPEISAVSRGDAWCGADWMAVSGFGNAPSETNEEREQMALAGAGSEEFAGIRGEAR
jgi:hypothetical protein